jgi:hypothetical protein
MAAKEAVQASVAAKRDSEHPMVDITINMAVTSLYGVQNLLQASVAAEVI